MSTASVSGTRVRRAVLAGLGLALLYMAGAAASGSLSPLARRPLLDGLTPPTSYRWVKPPPALAATNKKPTPMHFTLALGPKGSDVGAFSTQDGQFNMVFGEGAFAPSPGQSEVAFDVVPLDPARVAPVPSGLLAAGNAYRFTARYEPSRRPVDKLVGEVNAGVVYPLLATPVASPSGHLLLYSADGKAAWTRLQSTDAPGVHQVSARVPGPGYFIVAIPPGSATPAGHSLASRVRTILPVVALGILIGAAAFLIVGRTEVKRWLAARRRPAEQAAHRSAEAAARRPSPGKDAAAKPKPRPRPAGGKRPGDAKRRRRR
ncbi:MAG TPA: hypothetical protein VG276_01480 [Actinomycetes bacterium]|jgi:hypothetical protein|nr:hypothetical protein [Actinomycetes bacterium]